jgi:hypothetical protein
LPPLEFALCNRFATILVHTGEDTKIEAECTECRLPTCCGVVIGNVSLHARRACCRATQFVSRLPLQLIRTPAQLAGQDPADSKARRLGSSQRSSLPVGRLPARRAAASGGAKSRRVKPRRCKCNQAKTGRSDWRSGRGRCDDPAAVAVRGAGQQEQVQQQQVGGSADARPWLRLEVQPCRRYRITSLLGTACQILNEAAEVSAQAEQLHPQCCHSRRGCA